MRDELISSSLTERLSKMSDSRKINAHVEEIWRLLGERKHHWDKLLAWLRDLKERALHGNKDAHEWQKRWPSRHMFEILNLLSSERLHESHSKIRQIILMAKGELKASFQLDLKRLIPHIPEPCDEIRLSNKQIQLKSRKHLYSFDRKTLQLIQTRESVDYSFYDDQRLFKVSNGQLILNILDKDAKGSLAIDGLPQSSPLLFSPKRQTIISLQSPENKKLFIWNHAPL